MDSQAQNNLSRRATIFILLLAFLLFAAPAFSAWKAGEVTIMTKWPSSAVIRLVNCLIMEVTGRALSLFAKPENSGHTV